MSQSQNSTDTQALLQSMLQRLKLQAGREGQVYLHTPAHNSSAPTWTQDGERGASHLQGANNCPVNGFEIGANGVASKEFTAVIQQPGPVCEVDQGPISSPSHKENTNSDGGESRVLGRSTQIQTGREQLLPATSLKDVDVSSSGRTEGGIFGSSALRSQTTDYKGVDTSPGQSQGFTPKAYVWSLMPADGNMGTGTKEDKVMHMGNGGSDAKDMQIVPAGKTNSLSRRQQRGAGNKTRRWTQKIKERWKERQGSFGKKGTEDGGRDEQRRDQGTGILPQDQLLTSETPINTSNKDEEQMSSSLDNHSSPVHTEDSTNEGYMRSSGDFEFSLGPGFSLLDEIATGQEWAKFLNPNLPATSANQRASEEVKIAPNDPQTVNLHHGGEINRLAAPDSGVSMAQTTSEGFLPVSMDVSHEKQQDEVDQTEPMEHGNSQSALQTEHERQKKPAMFRGPADLLDNSALKSRVHLNRKRQHQSAERRDQRLQTDRISDGDTSGGEGAVSFGSETMKETGETSLPLHTINSPQPLSPPALPPKGVLKYSISQNSECSMEVETKRDEKIRIYFPSSTSQRRVEENRRVHFAEQVQTIPPPEVYLGVSDSEEDNSGAEEDSVIEESEMEQAAIEEEAPARRATLPAWIRALKRRNTGRKHR